MRLRIGMAPGPMICTRFYLMVSVSVSTCAWCVYGVLARHVKTSFHSSCFIGEYIYMHSSTQCTTIHFMCIHLVVEIHMGYMALVCARHIKKNGTLAVVFGQSAESM